jgi:hypothetical protein
MGIPSYFSYIVKNHKQIIRKLDNNTIQVDNFYLDCNSIIYDAVYKMEPGNINENITNFIIVRVIEKIKEYILLLNPSKRVFIAFDGVAPVAKLKQQRDRRFKSLYQNTISKTLLNNIGPDPWNTTAITPGTTFMNSLNERIYNDFQNTQTRKNLGVEEVIVSGSDLYGEGEHKIFDYIRKNAVSHEGQNTLIYGLDADLIMLSINHLPVCPNIYLFRETPHFIQSIDSELEPNENYVMDIPELTQTIIMDMNNGEPLTSEQQKNRVYDYIFLCFFLGNDFMPHFPALNIRTGGVDKMLQAYKATIGNTDETLTDGKKIHWKNVRKLIQTLADSEHEFIKTEHKTRDRREKNRLPDITGQEKLDCFINIPTYERSVEKFINPFKEGWQTRYYKSMFDLEIDDHRRKQICVNYLEGLEWTMKYYTSGCPDWRWCYNYDYPPLLEDLIHYVPYFDNEFIVDFKKDDPVSELVQLCYVLPKQSLHMLPDKLYKQLISQKSKFYKDDCEFSWSYCKYFWESHAHLPYIDVNELEAFVKSIR